MGAVLFVGLLVAAGIAIAVVLAVRSTNPLTHVADELCTPVPAADVESMIGPLLALSPKAAVEKVLPGTYTLTYRTTPVLAWVLAVVTFPIGLLALWFLRESHRLTVSISADDGQTRVRVFGRAHRKLALALGSALQLELRRAAGRR